MKGFMGRTFDARNISTNRKRVISSFKDIGTGVIFPSGELWRGSYGW